MHVLGIDAGGTKTVALLADRQGQIVGEGRGSGANLQTEGELQVEKILHEVIVQAGAGDGSVIPDAEYEAQGARILPDAAALFAEADLILKVKEPQEPEVARGHLEAVGHQLQQQPALLQIIKEPAQAMVDRRQQLAFQVAERVLVRVPAAVGDGDDRVRRQQRLRRRPAGHPGAGHEDVTMVRFDDEPAPFPQNRPRRTAISTTSERAIAAGPRAGSTLISEVPTTVIGALTFESGVVGGLFASFDSAGSLAPHIEIHGTAGSLARSAASLPASMSTWLAVTTIDAICASLVAWAETARSRRGRTAIGS